jgi:hypothetical protein
MDDAYLYAREKYSVAVSSLVGPADIKTRLFGAYMSIHTLSPRDIPEHLRDDHKALTEALTWVPVKEPDEGTLMATLREMSDDEADRLAKRFLELFIDVTDASRRAE